MIQSLNLNNYKNFIDVSLQDLKRMNLISGKNNTGKTSILESLFLFYDRQSPDVFFKLSSLRGTNSYPELTPQLLWGPYFYNFDTKNPISITVHDSGHKNKATYSQSKSNNAISRPNFTQNNYQTIQSTETTNNDHFNANFETDNKKAGSTSLSINMDQVKLDLKEMSQINKSLSFIPSSSKFLAGSDAERLGQLDIAGELGDLVKHLSIIEENLKSLSIVPISGQNMIYADIGLKRKVPLSFFGEGTGRLLSLILTIATTRNGIVCIDELENGIHYSLFPQVWNLLDSLTKIYNVQLFITTHSHDVLKGLYISNKENSLKEVSYYRVDKKGDSTKIKHYDSELLYSAIDSEWEIR